MTINNIVTTAVPTITQQSVIYPGVGIAGGGGGMGSITFAPNSGISVTGSLFEIDARLKKIEERLLILKPDPERLAKYEALKSAYDHYLLMEKLCAE